MVHSVPFIIFIATQMAWKCSNKQRRWSERFWCNISRVQIQPLSIFIKNGPTRPLFRLFSVFSNRQYNFYNKSMWKNVMSTRPRLPSQPLSIFTQHLIAVNLPIKHSYKANENYSGPFIEMYLNNDNRVRYSNYGSLVSEATVVPQRPAKPEAFF